MKKRIGQRKTLAEPSLELSEDNEGYWLHFHSITGSAVINLSAENRGPVTRRLLEEWAAAILAEE